MRRLLFSYLDGCVIEHLLPRVVKLPVLGVREEAFLGQRYGLLRRRVDTARPLVVRRRALQAQS